MHNLSNLITNVHPYAKLILVSHKALFCPLLFLIHINDFFKSLSNLNAIHLADDTTPSFDNINLINEELTLVQLWINVSRLCLIVEKNFMILSNRANKEDVSFTLNGSIITKVTSHIFLMVMIDETLKYDVEEPCPFLTQRSGTVC